MLEAGAAAVGAVESVGRVWRTILAVVADAGRARCVEDAVLCAYEAAEEKLMVSGVRCSSTLR